MIDVVLELTANDMFDLIWSYGIVRLLSCVRGCIMVHSALLT